MIIAVDFDGTLYNNGAINSALIGKLRAAQRGGTTVILWTCREGKTLQEAVSILHRCGFKPNYINTNAPQAIAQMGHDSRKVYADIYIDDKANK